MMVTVMLYPRKWTNVMHLRFLVLFEDFQTDIDETSCQKNILNTYKPLHLTYLVI